MCNETLNTLAQRSSCPAFTGELPEKEKLEAIAMAAAQSPSATNAQPWRIVVVSDRELLEDMEKETMEQMARLPAYKGFYDAVTAGGLKLFYNAPAMVVLPYDSSNPYAKFDCGIAAQSIALAAQSLGVASHIIAINELAFQGPRGDVFRDRLQFPEHFVFGLSVLLGYAAASKAPHQPDTGKILYVE